MLHILDVSENNGAIKWESVAAQVDGAIIRLGYRGYGQAGNLMHDKRAQANLGNAAKAGVPLGAYFCSQALSDAEAVEEADFCAHIIGNTALRLPVFLDSEWGEYQTGTGRADRISRARRTQYALAFLRRLKDLGYRTGLYTGNSWFRTELDGEAIRRDGHVIWIASVENVKPAVAWDGWQYSWKGRIAGISGDVDLSWFESEVIDLTKADVLKMIAEYEAEKAKKSASSYAADAWKRAKTAGVMDGTMPQAAMTREQFAVVADRLGLLK